MSSSSDAVALPARKRPRLELDHEHDCNAPVDHPSLYFDDGNVILSCGNTLFCVHRSLLSKHSPVFKDLFEPQEDVKPEMLRGWPHYPLKDSNEDVQALLEVIYDGLRISFPTLTIENFPLLSSLLRMCTKYEIERPRQDIIARIEAEWPPDLAAHDALVDAQRHRYALAHPHAPPPAFVYDDTAAHPASVLALLRACGHTSARTLAPLFYALSQLTPRFAPRGSPGGAPALGFNLAPLGHADVERLVIGLARLRDEHAGLCAYALAPVPHALCGAGLALHMPPVQRMLRAHAAAPLEAWRHAAEMLVTIPVDAAGWPCQLCRAAAVAPIQAARVSTWARMAALFELY